MKVHDLNKEFLTGVRFFKAIAFPLGVFPYRVTNCGLRRCYILTIYTVIILIALHVFVVLSAIEFFGDKENSIFIFPVCVAVSFQVLSADATIVTALLRSDTISRIISILSEVDDRLSHLSETNVGGSSKALISLCFLFHYGMAAVCVIVELKYPFWLVNASEVFVIFGILFVCGGLYLSVCVDLCSTSIVRRLKIVNGKLEQMIKEDCFNKSKLQRVPDLSSIISGDISQSVDPTQRHIRILQKCHYDLVKVTGLSAQIFTPIILLVVAGIFVHSLMDLYVVFREPIRTSNFDWAKILPIIKWIVLDFVRLLTLITSYINVKKAGDETAEIVHGLILEIENPDIWEDLKIFSLQLIHHSPQLDVDGWFRVDYSLILSIVGGLTTYLAIALFNLTK